MSPYSLIHTQTVITITDVKLFGGVVMPLTKVVESLLTNNTQSTSGLLNQLATKVLLCQR